MPHRPADREETIEDVKKAVSRYVGVRTMIETWRGQDPGVGVYLYGDDQAVLVPYLGPAASCVMLRQSQRIRSLSSSPYRP